MSEFRMPGHVPDSGKALILIPSPEGRIQDLGPHMSIRMMETDIVSGSALLAPIDDQGVMHVHDGHVQFAFEGNYYGTVNVESFHEKARIAAGRLVINYDSIAYGHAAPGDVTIAALYDLDRFAVAEVFDMAALSRWTGGKPEHLFPHRTPSGTFSKSEFRRLDTPRGETIHVPPMVYQFVNGQVLLQLEQDVSGRIFDHDDPDLRAAMIAADVPDTARRRVLGRTLEPDVPPPWKRR